MTNFFALFLLVSLPAFAKPPKLVVAVVIDQFRADNVARYQERFLPAKDASGKPGGFRYLLKNSAFFPQAQFELLQPMTGPGHATILSGTYPSQGGVPVNEWFENGEEVYCVQDRNFATVGNTKNRPDAGTSPRNFRGTTVGDELKNGGAASRVISIALKDRSSIFLGGQRADLAIWMDPDTNRWVSSNYYVKALPEWVQKLNARLDARAGQTYVWERPAIPASSLTVATVKKDGKSVKAPGDSFPHQFTRGTAAELASPAGLEITVEAAEAAVSALGLGKKKDPDLLAISLSSHDYVGHGFGPNSRENEEMAVAADRLLSRLLRVLDAKVGLKNVLFVLTADHGVAPVSDWLVQQGMDAGTVDRKELQARLEEKLVAKLGRVSGEPWIANSSEFNFWLSRKAIAAKKIERNVALEALKAALLEEKEFNGAFTERDVAEKKLPPGSVGRRILNTYVPGRSGDVVGLIRPFYYQGKKGTTHMAHYSYDETVPIFLLGENVKPGKYGTEAKVVDIAPTLSFLLDTLPPVMSEGRVLAEIFSGQGSVKP